MPWCLAVLTDFQNLLHRVRTLLVLASVALSLKVSWPACLSSALPGSWLCLCDAKVELGKKPSAFTGTGHCSLALACSRKGPRLEAGTAGGASCGPYTRGQHPTDLVHRKWLSREKGRQAWSWHGGG